MASGCQLRTEALRPVGLWASPGLAEGKSHLRPSLFLLVLSVSLADCFDSHCCGSPVARGTEYWAGRVEASRSPSGEISSSQCPFSMRAQAHFAPASPPSLLDQPLRGQEQNRQQAGGVGRINRNDDDFDFCLLSEPGEGGCFASWTSAENSLPDNHLGAFIAF